MSPEALESRYLDSLDCRGVCSPCEDGECCGDDCLEERFDEPDWETEAEDKAERMNEW